MQSTVIAPTLIYRENVTVRRIRRVIDITLASLLILLALPFVLAACIAILCEDGRPIFFRQRRAGRFERVFTIYKLRTMSRQMCGDAPSPTQSGDRRITKVGRFLRKTSVDELPQLFNVLRGDMSLVGPRPEMPIIIDRYERWQHLRHLVFPGITCIWQTECRSTVPLNRPEATALDLDYIRRASLSLDASLLVRTVASVVFPKGAY
jgi:lipopolysaccharide/colanic/teichoic acid biosynthesis glycosyltransferase